MEQEKYERGLSSYLALGKYRGWHIHKDGPELRLELGWLSIGLVFCDLESLISWVIGSSKRIKEEKEQWTVESNSMKSELENEKASRIKIEDEHKAEVERLKIDIEEAKKNHYIQLEELEKLKESHKSEVEKLKADYESQIVSDVRLKEANKRLEETQVELEDAESERAVLEEEIVKAKGIFKTIAKAMENIEE